MNRCLNASRAWAIGFSFALAACGGGGSSTTSPPGTITVTSSISASNMHEVSAHAYSAANSVQQNVFASSAAFVTGVTIDSSTPGLVGGTLKALYRALDTQSTSNHVVGVTFSQTESCTGGGTMLVSGNVASSATIGNGDSITIRATGCKEDGATLDGTMSITFNNVSGSPGESSSWSGTLAIVFTGFSMTAGTETVVANGDMSLGISQTGPGVAALTVSGRSLNMTETEAGVTSTPTMSNYSYTASLASSVYTFSIDATLSGTLGRLGASNYTIKTITPFKEGLSSFPSQGVLQITATDHSSVTLTVIDSTNVKLDLDSNGDGVVDSTVNTTLTALESHL